MHEEYLTNFTPFSSKIQYFFNVLFRISSDIIYCLYLLGDREKKKSLITDNLTQLR
jgi:hypothetical protein